MHSKLWKCDNYNTIYNKAAHKYFLKVFYKQTNKKEYKLQILKHNIHNTNVITMQNIILIAKVLDDSTKKKLLIIDISNVEVTQICNATNVLLKYNWH